MLWLVFAIMVLADAFVVPFLLDSILPGLSALFSIVIIALFPVIAASLFLDWRAAHTPSPSQSRLPPGTQSVSGEPVRQTRPTPTVRRDKRAARLETIVVTPQVTSGTTPGRGGSMSGAPTGSAGGASSRQFGASSKSSSVPQETESKVKEQLEAIEQQMARLEGELEETGVAPSTSPSEPESSTDKELAERGISHRPRRELGEEEATSELQAVDELLSRLEEKRAAGGVDDNTYERLRSKYLKRKNELKPTN